VNADALTATLLLVMFVGLGFALWASQNVDLATGAGAVAVVAAVALAARALADRVHLPPPSAPAPEYDSLAVLRESFQTGRLGRQAILTTVASLQQAVEGSQRTPLSMAEEEQLRTAPPHAFLEWVEARLAELEHDT
jgi:hypothetical protein